MTSNKFIYSLFFFLVLILAFAINTGCNSDAEKDRDISSAKSFKKHHKNFNISILLDLSDRISNTKNPGQSKMDIIFINNVLDVFKSFLSMKGVVQSEDRIKVIFYPYSNYEVYQEIADSLNIDFSKYDFPERKKIFDEITPLYNRQLNKLYSLASNTNYYTGSDLFNYFKHRIVDDCILNDSGFVNLLIILTDGYIYDINSKYQEGNHFSYLIPEADHIKRFRKLNNWEEVFEKDNVGIIKLNNDLSNLYVLVGEIKPVKNSPKDFDIIKKYWSEWLQNQNVQKDNFKILKTDLNTLNKDIVFSFFNRIIREQ